MAKGCLNKLSGNITVGCTIEQNGIKNVYLMYPEDVTLSLGAGREYVDGVTFVGSAKSYLIEGYKQNIQLSTSARAMDASMRLDYSLTFKIPLRSTWHIRAFSTGKFYAMVEYLSGYTILAGVTCPLECSAIDGDSNANSGMFTITLTAPEGSAGNYPVEVLTGAKNTIISKSV
ncbi:hypothetical protein EMB1_00003 [Bacteroides phage EMB1]|nr:hypothetical protein EMB1_00003 [Bacteroides phage EMB1]